MHAYDEKRKFSHKFFFFSYHHFLFLLILKIMYLYVDNLINLQISGYDKYGNPLKRLLSTIIQSTDESMYLHNALKHNFILTYRYIRVIFVFFFNKDIPEIHVESVSGDVYELEDISLKCYAESLIPMIVQWKQRNNILAEIESE